VKSQLAFSALLRSVADVKKYPNAEKFKKLKGYDNLWQFRYHELRLLCYQHRNTYVLINGFIKDQRKARKDSFETAVRIMNEDLERRT